MNSDRNTPMESIETVRLANEIVREFGTWALAWPTVRAHWRPSLLVQALARLLTAWAIWVVVKG